MLERKINIISMVFILLLISRDISSQPLYKVTRMSFSDNNYSDISPVIVKEGVIFCSNRRFSGIIDRTDFDGNRLYNIYLAEQKDTSGWRKPVEVKSERSTLFNNGPLCISPDGKTVYFTSEVETGAVTKRRNFKNRSGIFIADLSGDELTSIRPFKYNSPLYEVGQPSLSGDGKSLYFASDMPGGYGGSDLYRCELVNGEWEEPSNMGPTVNSQETENYPSMHASGRLYFSSNRPGGLGKLDVYYTTLIDGKWDEPVNLPEPINSDSDDFAYVADNDLQSGYFASNRNRNDDIYKFNSLIIRKASCDIQEEYGYCFEFFEENAKKNDTIPFRYEWRFGDGTVGSGSLVQHCYPGPGNYMVQLDVVNLITNETLVNQKTYNLEIADLEQPFISAPDVVNAGSIFEMNADSTNLPGWNIDRYYWNFGDETVATGKNVPKTYLKPGTYNIQLIVSTEPIAGQDVKEACISKNITVIHQP